MGERAAQVQHDITQQGAARLAGDLTKVPACESEDTHHDGPKHLRDSISLQVPMVPWQKLGAYIELGVLLRSGLESVLAGLPLGAARVRGNVAGPAAGRGGRAKAGGSAEG